MKNLVLVLTFGFAIIQGCSSVPRSKSKRIGLAERWSHPMENFESEKLGRKLDTKDFDSIPTKTADLGTWIWPLEDVKINSRFGKRRRGFHEGIDLKAAVGTPVYATQAGQVIYADNKIGGYGNMVVVKHSTGLFSVYAHLSKMSVEAGEHIKQRDPIGLSGKSGRTRGPHLHFEVRRGSVALNPVNFYERGNLFTAPGRALASKTKSVKISKSKRRRS
ncbi:MAG: M23 family metallopeptidase [Xanthomonadaceae bacterium]|nr:M23 family metallopeptidase [Xanthomonadaceae bacterium]